MTGADTDILDEYAAWAEQRTFEGLDTDIASFREVRRSARWERAIREIHAVLGFLGHLPADGPLAEIHRITRTLIEQEQSIEQ